MSCKIFKKLSAIVLCGCLIALPISVKSYEVDDFYSEDFVLLDANDRGVLLEKNMHKKIYPASMTKIMTVIVIIENTKNYDKTLFISEADTKVGSEEGASVVGLIEGESLTIEDALHCILLASGSDAAMASARYLAGTEDDFVELMNKKARSLGLESTHFTNSVGLHDENHYTSVYDMALLFDYCMKNEKFKEIISADNYILNTEDHNNFLITNYVDILFDNLGLQHDMIIGAKTGFTFEAGDCMISMAEINGKQYVFACAEAFGNAQIRPSIIDTAFIYRNVLLSKQLIDVVKKGDVIDGVAINFDISILYDFNKKPEKLLLSIEDDEVLIRDGETMLKRVPLQETIVEQPLDYSIVVSIGLVLFTLVALGYVFSKRGEKHA